MNFCDFYAKENESYTFCNKPGNILALNAPDSASHYWWSPCQFSVGPIRFGSVKSSVMTSLSHW